LVLAPRLRQVLYKPKGGAATTSGDVERALVAAASSSTLEVRAYAIEGLRTVFEHPCTTGEGGRCMHETAWAALEAGARRLVLGKWSPSGRRPLDEVTGDLAAGLGARADDDLMLSYIAVSAAGAIDAVRGATCVRARAATLRGALMRAYARAARFWAGHDYSWRDEQHAAFASAVFRWSADDGPGVITALADSLRPSAGALANFLRALVVVATYEPDVVPDLAGAWPSLMASGLSLLDNGGTKRDDRGDDALVRQLVPHPAALVSTPDLTAALEAANRHWLPLDTVTAGMPVWLRHARGSQWCVDALVGFLRAQPLRKQVDVGLPWLRDLVVAENGKARFSGFLLLEWLQELRDANALEAATWPHYRAVVDALALRQIPGARELQQRDE
jgi:hypothetical protein